jgi:hypothetical protein
MSRKAIGGHQSAAAGTTTWLTPPHIIDALGGATSFHLDPCAAPAPRPWPTALCMNALEDGDGLAMEWFGRVWLNGPYGRELEHWLARMAEHGRGTALMFARTETEMFHRHVWERANGLLFLEGRLHFHYPDGRRAAANGGAPSVLAAYGREDLDVLAGCGLPGALVPLRFARFALIAGLEQSWAEAVRDWVRRQRGPVSVGDAYRYFATHPKARNNPHWRAKIRQKLPRVARRVGPNQYEAAA